MRLGTSFPQDDRKEVTRSGCLDSAGMNRALQVVLAVAAVAVSQFLVEPLLRLNGWTALGSLAGFLAVAVAIVAAARHLSGRQGSIPEVDARRLAWADLAKAIAVVLVVAYHVSPTTMGHLMVGTNRAAGLYASFTTWLLPVRMPLFFLISGMLSVRALHRPWRAVWRPRVADILWPFVLWTALLAVPFALAYVATDPFGYLPRQAGWLVNFAGNYWYLPLLVAFFLTARMLRGAPLFAVALGVLLYFWSGPMPRDIGGVFLNDAMLTLIRFSIFWIWFAVGAFARPLVVRWARAPWWLGLIAFVAYWPLAWLRYERGMDDLTPIATVVGITAILVFARLLARWAPAARLGSYLAARTLPIYLYHPLLLALLVLALPKYDGVGSVVVIPLVPILVISAVAIACLAYDATRHRLPWLYRWPVGAAQREPRPAESAVPQRLR